MSWSCVNSNQGMESKSCLDDFCAWLACNRHLNNTILYCHISPEVKNQGFSCKKISNLTFAIKSMLKIFQKLKIKLIFRTFVLVRKGMFTFCLNQSCGFPFQFSLVRLFDNQTLHLFFTASVTRFGKISPLWHNYKVLGKLLRVYLVFGKMLIKLRVKC